MTEVYFEADADRYILSARGHATGSVAVCAAISGLVYALAGYLACREDAREYRQVLEEAHAYLEYGGGEAVEAAFQMALVGLLQIEKQYPELVKVEIAEK